MEENYQKDQGSQNSNFPNQKKRSSKKWIIWTFILLVILSFGIFAAYQFGKFHEKYYENDNSTADADNVPGWASEADYQKWENATFAIPEYDNIPIGFRKAVVHIFLGNKYEQTNDYFLTKIRDRAKKIYTFGNFTGQGEKEMAILFESNDFKSSDLHIISERGNMLYYKELPGELPTLKSFKKGSLIFINDMQLVPAPLDGIIKETKGSKYVYIYNFKTKTFDEHYQYTDDDIKNSRDEYEGEEEVDVPQDSIQN